MRAYIVCYDVTEDKIRNRIARVLKEYGDRVQYSVFEISLKNENELEILCNRLKIIADEDTKIGLYRLCANCRQDSHTLEGDRLAEMPAVVIL
ncbi:CRISPR-associated endonuclease Cas2 [Candidatus Venteria ishoeyi]|uniref:CRISPR-associated endoribonuclease Cas2 n=1 Tax=Candidatus Venteria ishoeyi TaxID=1899563 RepID=A0A1H6FDP5_9GAMM|nr:CRISPR-associated endonuclease Cas2 [Candidatus Venteria ishoeyi]MDM8545488.1 CRISPR-associated endonuclease Cas2 [Candidatus Venteria ishoeyi]SEH08167.1 CRISPR-associated endonuclease Cas2 2 [Candidatus Venteria ishoeyi]